MVNIGIRVETEICEDSKAFALKLHEVPNLSFYRQEMITQVGIEG